MAPSRKDTERLWIDLAAALTLGSESLLRLADVWQECEANDQLRRKEARQVRAEERKRHQRAFNTKVARRVAQLRAKDWVEPTDG